MDDGQQEQPIESEVSKNSYSSSSIPIEETPEILPTSSLESSFERDPQQKKKGGTMKVIIILILLFIIGYVASGYIRQYLASINQPTTEEANVLEDEAVIPTSPITRNSVVSITTPPTTTPSGILKTYSFISGITKQPIPGITFQLPDSVLSPTCDGSSCASQGTYLPGGTRFTVAARGKGQVLADYRNRIISDLAGKAFTVKETTVKGKHAVKFSGTFTGSTVGGYAFTKMNGVMIEVTPDISIELNHFAPSGITTNFEADDVIFDQIVASLDFSGVAIVSTGIPTIKPTVTIMPTTKIVPTTASSSSGL